jgi:SDR family mycofactocin-dependent oxidoreductase
MDGETVNRRLEGKVAFVTGAARGQGRSHAVRLAEEGADIIALDLCAAVTGVQYEASTPADLDETIRLVDKTGQRIIAGRIDTRDATAVSEFVDAGVDSLGRLDVVVANAAVCIAEPWDAVTANSWQTTIDINLTGTWNTIRAAIPHMIAAQAGSIIAIGSTAAVKGHPFLLSYVVSKHGVAGMVRVLTNELGPHNIRVNAVNPGRVDTDMIGLGFQREFEAAIATNPTLASAFRKSLPMASADPADISDAVLYLASDESRFVTGLFLSVDGGGAQS